MRPPSVPTRRTPDLGQRRRRPADSSRRQRLTAAFPPPVPTPKADLRKGRCPFKDSGLFLVRYCRARSEEHTSELQSLMRISYAVFCLKKKITTYQML